MRKKEGENFQQEVREQAQQNQGKKTEKAEKKQSREAMINFYNAEIDAQCLESEKPHRTELHTAGSFLNLKNQYFQTTKQVDYWRKQAEQYRQMVKSLQIQVDKEQDDILDFISNFEDHCISFDKNHFKPSDKHAKEILIVNEIETIDNKFEKSLELKVNNLNQYIQQYGQDINNINELLQKFRIITNQISESLMGQKYNAKEFAVLSNLGQVFTEIDGQYQFYKNFLQNYKQASLNVGGNDQQISQQIQLNLADISQTLKDFNEKFSQGIEIKVAQDLNDKIQSLASKLTQIQEQLELAQKQAKQDEQMQIPIQQASSPLEVDDNDDQIYEILVQLKEKDQQFISLPATLKINLTKSQLSKKKKSMISPKGSVQQNPSRSRSQEDRKGKAKSEEVAYDFTTIENLDQFDFSKYEGRKQTSANNMIILIQAEPKKVISYFFQRFHFFILEILVFVYRDKTFFYQNQIGNKQIYKSQIEKHLGKCYIYPNKAKDAKIDEIVKNCNVILNRQKTFRLQTNNYEINRVPSDLSTTSIKSNSFLFIFHTSACNIRPKQLYQEILKIGFFQDEKQEDGSYFALEHGMNLTIFIQFKKIVTIILYDEMNIMNTLKEIYSIEGNYWDFNKVFLKLQDELESQCLLLSPQFKIHKNHKKPLDKVPLCSQKSSKKVWENPNNDK